MGVAHHSVPGSGPGGPTSGPGERPWRAGGPTAWEPAAWETLAGRRGERERLGGSAGSGLNTAERRSAGWELGWAGAGWSVQKSSSKASCMRHEALGGSATPDGELLCGRGERPPGPAGVALGEGVREGEGEALDMAQGSSSAMALHCPTVSMGGFGIGGGGGGGGAGSQSGCSCL